MDELVKRRIAGAVVVGIAALAFIVWVNLSERSDLSWNNPVAPSFNEIKIDRNLAPPELEEIEKKLDKLKNNRQKASTNPAQDKNSQPQAKQNEKPSGKLGKPSNPLDEISFGSNSIPTRWVVQAASFTDIDSAEHMKQQLADREFISVIRSSLSSKGVIIYAVYVGPFLQASKAEENLKVLKDKLNIDGILRKWE